MPDEILNSVATDAPVEKAAASEQTTPVETKTEAPSKEAAPAETKAADKVADFVKKSTLLGEDAEGEKPAEEKPEGDKPAEVKPGTVPEKYEVKVPEGMQIDNELLDAVTPILKEKGFTSEEAQKLVDVYAAKVQAAGQKQHEAAMKAFDDQIETWGKETKAMLGPDAGKAMAPAAKLINTFAGKEAPALRALLNDTGLGNHPLMVKFLIAAGKAIGQDSFVDGGTTVAENTPEAAVGRMYPTMGRK